jgi:hypothetical protein
MAKGITNIAASVHQRLLNKAKESSSPFNELLQYFAIERFIYRLSKSSHADQFILKGALMFSAWCGPASRPTIHTGCQFNLMILFSKLLETGGLLIPLLPTTAWDDTTYRTLRGYIYHT